MLGKDETESLGTAYSEIAEAISKRANYKNNSEMKVELFRRMVFNILVSNTDDHLRNHGFIFENGGYFLSKAYDIVPTPLLSTERFQHLSVGLHGRLSTLGNAISAAGVFGLTYNEARAMIERMVKIVENWKDFYTKNGVTSQDIRILENGHWFT